MPPSGFLSVRLPGSGVIASRPRVRQRPCPGIRRLPPRVQSGKLVARMIGVVALLAALAVAGDGYAIQLISREEAALPPGDMPELVLRGSPMRRPNVVVVSPAGAGLVNTPLHLIVRFRAFGGARIDSESVIVTYKKRPAIDITQRIQPFISERGIDVPEAEVPPGNHRFRVQLKDDSGHVGAADFSFDVAH
jgi:hypothetical protein